jgi:hypothetical protein
MANPRVPAVIAAVTVLPSATESPTAAAVASSSSEGSAAAAGAVCGIRIGHRLARESVADALPGVFEGFSRWVAVDPQQLRKLMKAVPQKPGLYEVSETVRDGAPDCLLLHCQHEAKVDLQPWVEGCMGCTSRNLDCTR